MSTKNVVCGLLVVAMSVGAGVGCTRTYGRRVSMEELGKIELGHTTKAQVVTLLGEPQGKKTSYSGQDSWIYKFSQTSTNGATYVPVVGLFAGKVSAKAEIVRISFTNGVVADVTTSSSGTD